MASLRRLLRIWDLSADTVGEITPSDADKIGAVSRNRAVSLKQVNVAGRMEYPTGPGIYVKIEPIVVPRVVEWLLLQVATVEPEDHAQDPSEITDVRARLWDGTTEFWFTAGAWTAVTLPATQWNTFQAVSDNLGEWDPSSPLGLVFELSTTDGRYTPSLMSFRLLYSIDLPDYIEDWVYGAIIQGMKDEVRPVVDVPVVHTGGATIGFAAVIAGFESPITVVGVDAVWNEDDDPVHRSDLFTSYVAGTINLSSSPAVGKNLIVRAIIQPMVAVTTSQDYDELDRSPSILVDRITLDDLGEASSSDSILDVHTSPPAGVTLPAPRRAHLVFSLLLTAPLAVDLHRLAASVTQFLEDRRVISSPSTGERVTLRILETFDDQRTPNLSDLHTGSMSFRLENVYQHHRAPVDAFGVQTVVIDSRALAGGVCVAREIETGGT